MMGGRVACERYEKVPKQMVQVQLHQDVYNHNYKNQVRRYLHGVGTEQYIKDKFDLSSCTMDSIDWESITSLNKSLRLIE